MIFLVTNFSYFSKPVLIHGMWLIFLCVWTKPQISYFELWPQRQTIQHSHVDQYIEYEPRFLSRYTISTVYDCRQNIFDSLLMICQKPIFTGIIWSYISLVATYTLSWFRVRSLKPQIRSGALKLSYTLCRTRIQPLFDFSWSLMFWMFLNQFLLMACNL